MRDDRVKEERMREGGMNWEEKRRRKEKGMKWMWRGKEEGERKGRREVLQCKCTGFLFCNMHLATVNDKHLFLQLHVLSIVFSIFLCSV